MSGSPHHGAPARGALAAQLLVLALIVSLPLFPAETRGEAMAGCAALIALLALLTAHRPGRWWWPATLVVALVVACTLALRAVAPGAVPTALAMPILAAAAGIGAASLSPERRRSLAFPIALTVVAAMVAVHAAYQKLWGLASSASAVLASDTALPDEALIVERLQEGRAFAFFATPAALGGFLALALPVTVGWALSTRGRARWLAIGLAVLEAAAVVAAASATAIASLLGALVLAALAHGPRRRLVWGGAGLAIAALAAIVAIRDTGLIDPTERDSPWRLRAGNFRAAWSMFLDRPWAGGGPGSFGELYPGYRRPGDNEVQHAHNLPLELAADTGAVGGLVLGAVFFALFLGPLFRPRERDPPWVRGVAVGLGAFALQNLADFTAFFPSLLWLAAVLRGVIATTQARPRPLRVAPYAGLVSGLALAGVTLAAVIAGLSGIAWNNRLAARQAAFEGRAEDAERRASLATRLAPWEVDGWLLRAQATLDRTAEPESRRAGLESALDHAERAVRLSPVRPAARRVRGSIRASLGDLPGAYADLAEAARLYPLRSLYAEERDTLADRIRATRRAGGSP